MVPTYPEMEVGAMSGKKPHPDLALYELLQDCKDLVGRSNMPNHQVRPLLNRIAEFQSKMTTPAGAAVAEKLDAQA